MSCLLQISGKVLHKYNKPTFRTFPAKTTKVFAVNLLFTSVLLDFCSLH
jgi:hypothetical protein